MTRNRLIRASFKPVISAVNLGSLKNFRAELPSFVVPDPVLTKSNKSPKKFNMITVLTALTKIIFTCSWSEFVLNGLLSIRDYFLVDFASCIRSLYWYSVGDVQHAFEESNPTMKSRQAKYIVFFIFGEFFQFLVIIHLCGLCVTDITVGCAGFGQMINNFTIHHCFAEFMCRLYCALVNHKWSWF